MRHYTRFDRLLNKLENIRSSKPATWESSKSNLEIDEAWMSLEDKKLSASLMRVNHSGEVCAQALYAAQTLLARSARIKSQLEHAAIEEKAHLEWCEQRLAELGSHTSYLNPLWYTGSFALGLLAALPSDELSLSFLAETEYQVASHLKGHLDELPQTDIKSRAIIERMLAEEEAHADEAMGQGGYPLPSIIQRLMRATSKLMTTTARYI